MAALLPLGSVVRLMHDCACIDLEHKIALWTYIVGMHVLRTAVGLDFHWMLCASGIVL